VLLTSIFIQTRIRLKCDSVNESVFIQVKHGLSLVDWLSETMIYSLAVATNVGFFKGSVNMYDIGGMENVMEIISLSRKTIGISVQNM
jgi:hypothetical protein